MKLAAQATKFKRLARRARTSRNKAMQELKMELKVYLPATVPQQKVMKDFSCQLAIEIPIRIPTTILVWYFKTQVS